ncbi:unnamed protein product [Sympodiomycopsis kandeliae]
MIASATTKSISDLEILKARAEQAEKELARGADGPICLGIWPAEIYEMAVNVVHSAHRLAYLEGQIWFYGDPDAGQDDPTSAVSHWVCDVLTSSK